MRKMRNICPRIFAALLIPFALSGCVAALVPIAAGGVIAKTQLDARKRTKAAEATVAQNSEEPAIAQMRRSQTPVPPRPVLPPQPAMRASDRLLFSDVRHPYLAFTLYALNQAEKRVMGMPVRSAVLVRNISLADPKTIDCTAKPMAVIIDLDESNGIENTISKAGELAILLETLREADIHIAWLSADTAAVAQDRMTALQSGDTPALKKSDLVLTAQKRGLRKQEQRWGLAKTHCVLAIAGDRKADFDELYDYLRKPDLAIRLDAFIDRGWFELPAPTRGLGL
jgi:hypothetical protein